MTRQKILVVHASNLALKLSTPKLKELHPNHELLLLTNTSDIPSDIKDKYKEIFILTSEEYSTGDKQLSEILNQLPEIDRCFVLINFVYDWPNYSNVFKAFQQLNVPKFMIDGRGEIKDIPSYFILPQKLYQYSKCLLDDFFIALNALFYFLFKMPSPFFQSNKHEKTTTSQKHIAFYSHRLAGGGLERVYSNLIKYLLNKGYEVDWVVDFPYGFYLDDFPAGANLHVLSNRSWFSNVKQLSNYLRDEQPDILLSARHKINLAAVTAKGLTGENIRLVLRTSTNFSTKFKNSGDKFRYYLFPTLIRRLYPECDATIFLSKGNYEELKEITRANFNNPKVIYNPVDIEHIKKLKKEPVKHPWFDSETPIILGAGRLVKQKDFATLIKALSLIKNDTSARVIITGQGKLKNELEKLISTLDLQNRVRLLGHVSNPYKYMHNSDIFVLSSLWEGFGNVIVEALAVGTPVISTDCPSGPSEILAAGQYGKLVSPGRPQKLAEAIKQFLGGNGDPNSTPDERKTRANDFNLEKICAQYEETFIDSIRE